MSKSRKKPIYQAHMWKHHSYNRMLRRCFRHDLKKLLKLKNPDLAILRLGKEIINDYNITDYKFFIQNPDLKEKFSRK